MKQHPILVLFEGFYKKKQKTKNNRQVIKSESLMRRDEAPHWKITRSSASYFAFPGQYVLLHSTADTVGCLHWEKPLLGNYFSQSSLLEWIKKVRQNKDFPHFSFHLVVRVLSSDWDNLVLLNCSGSSNKWGISGPWGRYFFFFLP